MTYSRHLETILYEGAAEFTDPADRVRFLDQTCAGNPELRARLEELLEVQDQADAFFVLPRSKPRPDQPAGLPEGPSGETVGATIGRYRLLQRMGEGGCGVVYFAEQLHPVRRKVALKIIRLGMDTESVIARFEMERQSLALMEHPNIARVLDAGATVTGRPYFVMELVDGERVTDFCDTHRLGIRERLGLFMQICLAIQHAHQKSVIHRDIKPSNVLVRFHDGVAVPKVIDFGIAKATSGRRGDDTAFTAMGQFLGTPAYMSPEQASGSGMDVDTRSDIYSLGVLLYELLAGRPPYDPKLLKQAGVDELRRILREQDPPPPSEVVASVTADSLSELAARRGCEMEAQKLSHRLRGDLDWIVMKAMEKDRQRRYVTAQGLAMDVRRHLDHEPVSAGPPGRRYRFRKLVRRNKPAFAAGTLVLITLLAGLGISTGLFLREKEARQVAARLQGESERARANEALLRQRSEIRETITRAAVKLRNGDTAGADELLAEIPIASALPSIEGANTYQELGLWHVTANRWPQAAARYAAQVYSLTTVDASDTDNVSRDLMPAASALCEAGNFTEYGNLRDVAIRRFGRTENTIVAEQVIKTSLLRPASREILTSLGPLVERVTTAVRDHDKLHSGGDSYMAAWRCLALALYHQRAGDFPAAEKWAARCLFYPDENHPREAAARLVRSMALHQLHRPGEAREELQAARDRIGEKLGGYLVTDHARREYWFDWINARVLLREALAMMGE